MAGILAHASLATVEMVPIVMVREVLCFMWWYILVFNADFDECKLELDNCSEDACCTNTPGSYLCTCKKGYIGNGTSCDRGKYLCKNLNIF